MCQNSSVVHVLNYSLISISNCYMEIDLLAILQKSLDQALFLYNFIREVRSSGVRASFTIVHIRKSFRIHRSVLRFRFVFRIAKTSIADANTPKLLFGDRGNFELSALVF